VAPQELEERWRDFDGKSLFDNVNAARGADGVKTTEGFIRGMFTKQYPVDAVNWVIQENLKFPREYAARLLLDHATNRWRDLIPAINIPALVVGGKASLVPWSLRSGSGKQIKGREDRNLRGNEGGAPFMFMENPEKFTGWLRSSTADAVGLRIISARGDGAFRIAWQIQHQRLSHLANAR